MSVGRRPEASLYRRDAAHVTSARVLHPLEKAAAIADLPRLRRRAGRAELERAWAAEEAAAAASSDAALAALDAAAASVRDALRRVKSLLIPELRGKADPEIARAERAMSQIASARAALRERDFGAAGAAAADAVRELSLIGGSVVVPLNRVLAQAAIGRAQQGELRDNYEARQEAKRRLEALRGPAPAEERIAAIVTLHELEADGYRLAATVLSGQVRPEPATGAGREVPDGIVAPHELETFDDVGGLADVKERLRATIGTILDRPEESRRYQIVHNGILFHGPPGTGKTLLSRALAGEYGLRYLRFSPAAIGSAYLHETASKLRALFELARRNVPCLLFLDEVDAIASARDDQAGGDHREVVTQLMNCLEEYRATPGLVITAATNDVERLDPGLREGRFDARILVPLPDREARVEIVRVHLERRGDAVDWSDVDLDEVARATHARNAAALAGFVSLAAQSALSARRPIRQEDLMDAVRSREGKDRASPQRPVTWDDVVLPAETRERLTEIMHAFARPDLAATFGVAAPAGLLLFGPPGTGKTTIARAMATEVEASFYERSAADLLSKWAGESEGNVAKLFERARANRPSIVFVDEIDALLRRRGSAGAAAWEERVVAQFLRELDGLTDSAGVLLVGATNRVDIVDPAVQGRRLTPIEVPLPDDAGRARLLEILCRDALLSDDVDLGHLAAATNGMSGADLKRIRDAAGMKALARTARGAPGAAAITNADFDSALRLQRTRASLVQA